MIAQLSGRSSAAQARSSCQRSAAQNVRPVAALNAVAGRAGGAPQRVAQANPELCRPSRRSVVVKAAFNPPTVSETKKKFTDAYTRPIPALYNTVVQELLVQQHFIRYSVNYKYNAVYALGFVSVFDQILDGFESSAKEKIFTAYVQALGEDPAKYRSDAETLESQAKQLSGPEGLTPDGSVQSPAAVAAAAAAAAAVPPPPPKQAQADAETLEAQAKQLSGPEGLTPDASHHPSRLIIADVQG